MVAPADIPAMLARARIQGAGAACGLNVDQPTKIIVMPALHLLDPQRPLDKPLSHGRDVASDTKR